MNRTRIVILGAGFGGAYCAQELERKLSHLEVEITLIDETTLSSTLYWPRPGQVAWTPATLLYLSVPF